MLNESVRPRMTWVAFLSLFENSPLEPIAAWLIDRETRRILRHREPRADNIFGMVGALSGAIAQKKAAQRQAAAVQAQAMANQLALAAFYRAADIKSNTTTQTLRFYL